MKASTVVSRLMMRRSAHRVSLLRTSSRPGNCNQKRTLLECFHIVMNAGFQTHQFATAEFDSLVGKLETNSTLECLNRNPRVGVMFPHFRTGLHQDKDDAEIRVLR